MKSEIIYEAPDLDTVEVSLFGLGVGECIVVHVGNGKWLIIDSCVDKEAQGQPSAIKYLEELGVNIESDVILFIISHWHSDHIRGAAEIATRCESAKFVISSAMDTSEAITLVNVLGGKQTAVESSSSGIDEMHKVLAIVSERKSSSSQFQFAWATPDRVLYSNQDDTIRITSLSPSDPSIAQAKIDFQNNIENSKGTRKVIPQQSQNHNAIAIWIATPCGNILLGADLEEQNNSIGGWTAVVNSMGRPSGRAKLFKIPHHGSSNGHCEAVWQQMIDSDEVDSILTTYNNSSLPNDSDIERIKGLSRNLFSTTIPQVKKAKKNRFVEKLVKGAIKSRKTINTSVGHIQVRLKTNGIKEINLNEFATQL